MGSCLGDSGRSLFQRQQYYSVAGNTRWSSRLVRWIFDHGEYDRARFAINNPVDGILARLLGLQPAQSEKLNLREFTKFDRPKRGWFYTNSRSFRALIECQLVQRGYNDYHHHRGIRNQHIVAYLRQGRKKTDSRKGETKNKSETIDHT